MERLLHQKMETIINVHKLFLLVQLIIITLLQVENVNSNGL